MNAIFRRTVLTFLMILSLFYQTQAVWYLWDPNTEGSLATSSSNWLLQDNNERSGYWILEGTENRYTGYSNSFNNVTIENATITHTSTDTASRANISGVTVNAGGVLNCMRVVTDTATGTIRINEGGSVITENQSSYLGDNATTTMYLNGGTIQFKGTTVLAQHHVGWYSIRNGGRMEGTTLTLGGDNNNNQVGPRKISKCDVYVGSLSDSTDGGNITATTLRIGYFNPGVLNLYRGSVGATTLNLGYSYRNNGDGERVTTGTGKLINYFGQVTAGTLTVGTATETVTGDLVLAAEGGVVTANTLTVNAQGTIDFQVTPQGVGKLVLTGTSLTNNGKVKLSRGSTLAVMKSGYTIYEGTPSLTVTDGNALWNVLPQADNIIEIALDSSKSAGEYTINSGWQLFSDGVESGWLGLEGLGGDPIEMVFSTDLTTEAEVSALVANLLTDNTITTGDDETDRIAPNIWAEGLNLHLLMDPLSLGSAFTWDFSDYGVALTGFSASHVPEPASWVLLLGMLGLYFRGRRIA
ncbi:MAG: PEP-CTERM sorting domain-containing protein [Planctomycetia bacterium]|nr:PEP-CTERM sorting domain-containing protein [Planctomycetia bacterium]